MLESHLTRVAVNLCVASALLLPAGGWNATKSKPCVSDASSTATATCASCGRCSVSSQGELCGCCCQREKLTPKEDVALTQERSCCHRSVSAAAKEEKPSHGQRVGICLCGHEQAPVAPAPQNRTTIEQVILALLATPAVGQAGPADGAGSVLTGVYSSPPSLLPHDSQRRLCVWLI